MPTIKYAVEQRIATICLNRDEKRNALDKEMAEAFLQGLDQAEKDQARVVMLRGNSGIPVWCAGHDLEELDPQDLHVENPLLRVARRIQSVSLPVVAMVEGSVHGGGLILLLSADIVIAAENAEIAIASSKLGIPLPPDLHAYWLRIMGIHKAKELLFTAAAISADDAYHAGLYNHVVRLPELEHFAGEVARKITKCSPEVVAATKHQLNRLALQTALAHAELAELAQRNSEILDSEETRKRISTVRASVRHPRTELAE